MESERSSRRRQGVVVLLLTIALLALPAIAVATHVFSDVPDGGTHAAGIHYVAATGITTGCTPTRYCPNDNLTRAQMGTFLHRASGNAPGTAPSVNAAKVSAGAIQTVQSQKAVAAATFNVHSVSCPAGTEVVGGGGFSNSTEWRMEDSRPVGEITWSVSYRKDTAGAGAQTTTVYARCMAVGQ